MRWYSYSTLLLVLYSHLCSAATRRILHEPFFPVSTLPPSQPPSPPPSPTPSDLPFFPNYPSPPAPPPPAPSAFATWPANISTLVIPRSTRTSHVSQKLLAVSLASSVSAIFLLIFVAVYYHRRPCNDSRSVTVKHNGKKNGNFCSTAQSNGHVPRVAVIDSPEIFPLPPLSRFRDNDEYDACPTRASDTVEDASFGVSSARKVDDDLLTSASEWDFSKRILIGRERDIGARLSPESSSSSSPETLLGGVARSSPPVPPPPPPPVNGSFPVRSSSNSPVEIEPFEMVKNMEEAVKPKLKPLHWDKVRAHSDREMVWDQLKSSSFIVDEEMIESLFIVNSNPKPTGHLQANPQPIHENRVLDAKRAQNISILLRALNVTTEEVCDALMEGNSEAVGAEILESLLKMAPTKEEERRLREFTDGSPTKLGPAEKFLKAILDIPLAFKRAEAMLYISNFETEIEYLKNSFHTLEMACGELRNSRMLLKLLEAVLKTGNRMNVGTNRGDADSFTLDTLLKLVDIKGVDGRTTLLHFVVQEMIRTEGNQAVSGLSGELGHVKKAAGMDPVVLTGEVATLARGIGEIGEGAKAMDEEGGKFGESIDRFLKYAEAEICKIEAHERVAISLVKEITEYFHGDLGREEAHPLRIFMVVRDFLGILERVCREIIGVNERTTVSSAHKFPVPVNPMLANGRNTAHCEDEVEL